MSKEIDRRRRPERAGQILEAALRVFASKGYESASLRQIAEEAGLKSAQLLSWYFPNKKALFEATVIRYAGRVIEAFRETPSQSLAPRAFLTQMALRGLEIFADEEVRLAFQLLLRGDAAHIVDVRRSIDDFLRDNLYHQLAAYLDAQAERGTLRAHDSTLAAQVFIGQVWNQIQARYFVPMIFLPPSPDDVFVEGMVEFFLSALS